MYVIYMYIKNTKHGTPKYFLEELTRFWHHACWSFFLTESILEFAWLSSEVRGELVNARTMANFRMLVIYHGFIICDEIPRNNAKHDLPMFLRIFPFTDFGTMCVFKYVCMPSWLVIEIPCQTVDTWKIPLLQWNKLRALLIQRNMEGVGIWKVHDWNVMPSWIL
jgi:hypothetical protein